jgi:hypothetical protein
MKMVRTRKLPKTNPKCATSVAIAPNATNKMTLTWLDGSTSVVALENRSLPDVVEEWSWLDAEKRGRGLQAERSKDADE